MRIKIKTSKATIDKNRKPSIKRQDSFNLINI